MKKRPLFMVCCVLAALLASDARAQTRENGPWWPHPIWGPEDREGAANWIKPEKVLEAVGLVTKGQVYELGQTYESGMPLFGSRTFALHIPGGPTYRNPMGKNQLVGNDDFLCTEVGQVGTQFDGLAHIGKRMTMADGSVKDVYYNGVTGEEMLGTYGMRELGIETVRPIITRGILIDIAGEKGVERLPKSYEVTVDDIRRALARQGMTEESIRPGDALFFRYGWSSLWSDPQQYNDSPAGIGVEAARWIVDRRATMIGSDSWSSEVIPNPDPELAFPVHEELLTRNGIFNLENMRFDGLVEDKVGEFLFVFAPVPFKGATGSPGRPIAIR